MLSKIIDGQYRRPSGLLGRLIGRKMERDHRSENLWTVRLVDAQPADRVLEVGFGPGSAVEALARRVTGGQIVGVDFSRTMVKVARKRNARAIQEGRVDLRHSDVTSLPFSSGSFDKAFTIHSIYFWSHPLQALAEIHRVLKPDGKLILTVLPKEKWHTANPTDSIGTPECHPYSGVELSALLKGAGFTSTQAHSDPDPAFPSNFSVIGIK